jgi:hypothetical protein
VTAQFDLNLLPMYRVNGQEWPLLPGLLTVHPPRKAARGRDGDHLLIFLTISGNIPFSSAEYNRLTAQMAEQFYKIPGSLTSAMRATAENLNQFLVDRNLRSTGRGQYAIGRLLLGVLRGSQLVLIQSGPTHVFQAGSQVRHIHDAQISGRGLGLSQSTPIYFTQLDLNPGDLLLLCPQLPAGWEAALLSEKGGTTLESLRQKLAGVNREDISAVLVLAEAGAGRMPILRGTKPEAEAPQPPSPEVASIRPSPGERLASILAESGKPEPSPEGAGVQPASADTSKGVPQEIVSSHPVELPSERRTRSIRAQMPAPVQDPRQVSSQPNARDQEYPLGNPGAVKGTSLHGKRVARRLANFIGWVRRSRQSITGRLGRFLPNLLPAREGQAMLLPGSAMAIIAIIVPLIVVTIATVVYMRYGRVAQFEENYQLAIEAAVGAVGSEDPATIRHAWETTIYYLDKAEYYQETQQSQALREEAQSALDGMDGVIRIDFRPAIVGGLSKTVQISRMVATDTDLYLLNVTNGSVIRTFLTNQGYAVDSEFKCGPGSYGGYQVGSLLDIVAMPAINDRSATLLGMDASGKLLYCAPGRDPQAYPLTPPDTTFKGVIGFTMDVEGENLYILDPPGNAVWVYERQGDDFGDLPLLFFSENHPEGMPGAIDILVTTEDLYLLYGDGHITLCSISRMAEVPMRCYDPTTLQDDRPGHQPGPIITDAIFTQMSFAAPPDPSLYLLVPNTHAIYQFSPRPDSLTLRGQFRATVGQSKRFTSPATAMAISLNRYLFISIENQVYFATDVP